MQGLKGMCCLFFVRSRREIPCLSLLLPAVLAFAAQAQSDEKSPIGPFNIELTDHTSIRGMLLDINDDAVLLRTAEGDRKIERKRVKRMDPLQDDIPLNADARPAEPSIGRIAKKEPVLDDLEGEEVKDVKREVPANDRKLMAALKAPVAAPPGERMAIKEAGREPLRTAAGQVIEGREFDAALAFIETREYKRAAQMLRTLVGRSTEAEVARVDALSRQRFNRSLAELLVMCNVLQSCGPCKGEGTLRCDGCNGTGYQNKNIPVPDGNANTGVKSVSNASSPRARVALCDKCRGNGYDICMGCCGTRLAQVEVTPYEREAYTNYCLRLAVECLGASEGNYADTARENLPAIMPGGDGKLRGTIEQVWIRDSLDRVRSDINRLWRAEGFYRLAMRADPALAIRYTGKDLTQELNKITLRRQHLYSEMAERARFKDFHQTE